MNNSIDANQSAAVFDMSYRDKANVNCAIEELRALLPISGAIRDGMDRLTVVRMSRSLFAIHNTHHLEFPKNKPNDPIATSPLILQALDIFCFVLDCCGRFVYVTESVSTNFGFSQYQLIGSPIYDFIHPDDKRVIFNAMHNVTEGTESSLLLSIRFQCKQARRHCGFTRDGYKIATIEAFCRRSKEGATMLATGSVFDRNGYPEVPLSIDQFVIHASLDLKVIIIAGPFEKYLGLRVSEICNRSIYQLIHPEDTSVLQQGHSKLIEEREHQGQVPAIRFISGKKVVWISLYLIKTQVPGTLRPPSFDVKVICTHLGDEPPRTLPAPMPYPIIPLNFYSQTNALSSFLGTNDNMPLPRNLDLTRLL